MDWEGVPDLLLNLPRASEAVRILQNLWYTAWIGIGQTISARKRCPSTWVILSPNFRCANICRAQDM